MSPLILAHQSGWPEFVLVGVPVALFAWILHVANKRADAQRAERDGRNEPPAVS